MANINRGEFDLTINDQTYSLVLTLDDLCNLENQLGVGAEEFFQQLVNRSARANHVNAVLARAFRKSTPRLSPKEIEMLVPGVTYLKRREAVGQLVAGALNFLNEQNQDEPEEAAEKVDVKDPLSETGGSTGLD